MDGIAVAEISEDKWYCSYRYPATNAFPSSSTLQVVAMSTSDIVTSQQRTCFYSVLATHTFKLMLQSLQGSSSVMARYSFCTTHADGIVIRIHRHTQDATQMHIIISGTVALASRSTAATSERKVIIVKVHRI